MKLKKVPVLDMFGYIEGFECPSKRIKIVKCDKESADAVIVPNHYSHKAVSNSCINMLVIYNDRVEGAMQIGYGIRPKIKGDLDAECTREFDRMWLSDNMPKFSETIALSLLRKYLQATHKEIKHLISYADTSAGKTGTIYKAGNYRYEGKIKADFYILPTGERIHPVTMWHMHKTRAMETLKRIYPGIKKADGYQLKFVSDL